jgi:hypothetical protein
VHLAQVLSTVTVSDAARNAVTNLPQVFASNSKCHFEGVDAGKLVPDLLKAILDWRRPEGVTLPGLLEPFLVEWVRQRRRNKNPRAER